MYEDQHDNFWIGTTEGLFLRSPFIERFELDKEIPHLADFSDVRALLQVDSLLYVANFNGLFVLNTKQAQEPPRKLIDESFKCLLQVQTGEIYAGNRGFYRIDPTTFELVNVLEIEESTAFQGGNLWGLAEDRAGGIWLGFTAGLSRYDPKRGVFERYRASEIPSLLDTPGQNLLVDRKGRLWAASLRSGVYLLEAPHELEVGEAPVFRNFNYDEDDPNSLSNSLSVFLTEGKDGAIWVGTEAGVNRIDGTDFSIKRYLRKDGLIDEKIMGLSCDDNGNLWGSTVGHGIFQLDQTNENFSFFNRSDGLTSNNFLLNAVHKNEEGLLFFGSDEQVQCIDPERIAKANKPQIPFQFTDIQFANQANDSLYESDRLELPYNYQSFTIRYTTLNFYQAEKTTYHYQLEGVHTDWQSNGKARSLVFAGLQPGAYRLKVKPINSDLQFAETYIALDIIIHWPWWQRSWAYGLYVFILAGLLYALYRFQLTQQLRRAEALRLQELDSLKTRFFTNITHELRTPLTIILGIATQLKTTTRQSLKDKGGLIHRNGQHLLDLINQILDLSKLEAGKLPVQFLHGDVLVYLNYLLESFHSMASAKQIRLHFLPDVTELWMDYDANKTKQIISNLLSNALKHTPAGGDIYLQVKQAEETVIFVVRDTGSGIAAKDLPHIFERFYQADAHGVGTGIGLSFTRELVHLLNGTIVVDTQVGKGTNIEVELPIGKAEGVPLAQPLGQPMPELPANTQTLIEENRATDRPLLLIVEDNVDVRNFLTESLRNTYQLIVAENGAIGIEKAQTHIPDLIISDVMMPEKDGFELCETLKKDKRTSHIPVILLTAKADVESRIEGLEQGADAYLAKPFEEAELAVRIRKLLELREALQTRYQDADFWEKKPTKPSHTEDAFVLRVRTLVEKNLEDSSFGIPQLCHQLGISRVHLHRKLKALTNQSTSHFIRRIRLQKAHELLRTSDLNVSEIAYEVGFADPTYFSRLYRETFGESPSQHRKLNG
jgi:signal transduction histidine kinase/DNA-binding response OmpR family regulator/ligand-binding sensor domain-containing protein